MLIESPEAFKSWLVKTLAPMWVNICRTVIPKVSAIVLGSSPGQREIERVIGVPWTPTPENLLFVNICSFDQLIIITLRFPFTVHSSSVQHNTRTFYWLTYVSLLFPQCNWRVVFVLCYTEVMRTRTYLPSMWWHWSRKISQWMNSLQLAKTSSTSSCKKVTYILFFR